MSESKDKTGHDHSHDHEDGDHDHGHGHGGGEHHSHVKTYMITAAVLTLITAVEVGILFVPALTETMKVVLILATAIGKFIGVIAIFMHLRDDRFIFRLLFVAPLIIAVIMIIVLGIMVERHFNPWSGKYDTLLIEMDQATLDSHRKVWTLEDLNGAYTAQAANNYAAGKAIYDVNCAGCHRVDGGGATGPAFTDDCYKNGNDLTGLVEVVTDGVSGTQMAAWKPVLGKQGVVDAVLYIRSLHKNKVPNAKSCEGPKATAMP